MGRRGERRNRDNRRAADKMSRGQSGSDIEFPGFMGFLQKRMKSFFLAGIVLLVASLGFPIFTSLIGDSTPEDSTPEETPSATSTMTAQASPTIQRRYASEPELTIDKSINYEAVITLAEGDRKIRIELLADESPGYVNNFVFLSRNNFYDGLTFHRVIEGFVAQGGDPTGTGMGGAGYLLTEEFNDIRLDSEGLVSMAKSARGVDAAQFFITLGPTPWLTGDFTVFGRVVEGMDIVHSIRTREPGAGQPAAEVISTIMIVEK